MANKVYKIEGLDCASCAKMIELDLEDAGIAAKCDFAKEELVVANDTNGLEEKVGRIVAAGGYKLIKTSQ